MPEVLVVDGPGQVSLHHEPSPGPLPDGRFDVRTRFSGLSAGTDLSWVKGTNPALHTSWDAELGLFRPAVPGAGHPVRKVGYMQVGEVVASRSAVPEGALVAMTYGHRTDHRADPGAERVVRLPGGLDPVLGIYAAHMGPIAANGVLHAAADAGSGAGSGGGLGDGVRDRVVVVVGAGVVGLLVALFAAHHGAGEVTVVDPTADRRAVAAALGFAVLDPDAADAVPGWKAAHRHGPGDHGADVVFQCRGRDSALALALRLLRPQAAVIDLAFYPGGSPDLRLGEEFHHGGLTVRCAQIGRVPRGLAAVWDRDRLSGETLDLLAARGDAVREHLITDLVPWADAARHVADLAAGRRAPGLQTVFVV